MADAPKSNLEPIDESDVDLASKFGGKSKSVEIVKNVEVAPEVKEMPAVPEQIVERKEGSAEKEAAYAKILSKAPAPTPATSDEEEVKKDAQAVSLEQDAESRISNLLGLAQTKGVIHAVKVAKNFEDNYVMDEFHDRLLADELHDALIQKGLIKDL
jgi:hypothetical protein